MANVTREQQFHGTALLTILHLRRLAKSNDIDAGFAAAREMRMIDDEQERFMRDCLHLDEATQAGSPLPDYVTPDFIQRMQACILSINSADPA